MSETETVGEPVKKNKGGRPRKHPVAIAGPSFSDEQFNKLLAVLAANKPDGGIDLAALKTVLESTAAVSASTMKKALKPENEQHPGKSVFSRAQGDVADPRPTLPFEFFMNGYPCHKFPETEHWRELELMCQVVPGEYTVMRKDFTPMAVTVRGERDMTQTLTKVSIEFPVSREEKGLVPPKVVLLYQLVYPDHPRRRFVEAMQEYMQIMLGEETPTPMPVAV